MSSTVRPEWIREWQNAVTDLKELWKLLSLPEEAFDNYNISHSFGLKVPHSYIKRMRQGDLSDPLLQQIIISPNELLQVPGYTEDPLQEKNATIEPGLLKKYARRILVITTGACPIHCRYCFRRHFPYEEHGGISRIKQQLKSQLLTDTSIKEVILSGGDPLSLKDEMLFELIQLIEEAPAVETLRIHTRFPVVIPSRLTNTLIQRLAASRLSIVCVFHINHPQEINSELTEKTHQMHAAGLHLLNQSVLLQGINSCENTLIKLSEDLWSSKILPYYLHQLDKVQGAHHFAVTEECAVEIISKVRDALPGYLVPQLVQEIAGAGSKIPIFNS